MVDKTFVLGKIASLDEVLGQIREYEDVTVASDFVLFKESILRALK